MVDTAYPKSWIRCIGDLVSFMVFGECMHRYAVSSLMDTRIGCQNRSWEPREPGKGKGIHVKSRGGLPRPKHHDMSFDVNIRMDWLSDHKAEIICHEKVVRIPLLDGKVLRVLGEKPEEKMRQLMSVKAKEQKQEEIMVVKDFLRSFQVNLKNSRTEVSFDQAHRLGEQRHVINENGIHIDPSKIEAVKNWEALRTPSEVCSFLGLASDYDCQIRYHPGKVNVVADALSRKERVKPKRKGLYEMVEHRSDGALYYLDRIWVPLKGDVRTLIIDKVYKLKYSIHPGADKMYYDLRDMYWWLGTRLDMSTTNHPQTDGQNERTIQKLEDMLRACVLDFGGSWDVHLSLVEFSYNNSYHSSVRCAPFEALYAKKCRSLIMWGEKSYVDKRRKPLDFSVGDYVLLKVSPWKGVVRFRKKGKLAPRFVGPFEITERIDHVEILEREFKKLKRSRIAIVKVRWNSKRGPEFTAPAGRPFRCVNDISELRLQEHSDILVVTSGDGRSWSPLSLLSRRLWIVLIILIFGFNQGDGSGGIGDDSGGSASGIGDGSGGRGGGTSSRGGGRDRMGGRMTDRGGERGSKGGRSRRGGRMAGSSSKGAKTVRSYGLLIAKERDVPAGIYGISTWGVGEKGLVLFRWVHVYCKGRMGDKGFGGKCYCGLLVLVPRVFRFRSCKGV
uniref:B3 DNA-binding domain protein n=1 Tax=Tanacetum cinerariifolium TaxID=118510 RepID=A0A6L2L177_TANCI|nr:B3 DNA-binding domain protein [Tanacetum cinerariifolium]